MNAQNLKLLQERQFGIISDIFPGPTSTAKTRPTDSASSTSSTHSTSTTTTTSTATTSSSSTSTSTTSSSSFISSSIPPPPPVVVTTVAGQTITLTTSAGAQTSTISPSPATATAFLQNKVLSGVILGIVGLVGLTILIVIATCVIKRRRNKKLLKEAVMFDPVSVASFNDRLESGTMEKHSSLGHERDSAEYGSRPYPTATPYVYPTTAPHGEVGHFQPPPAWPTPVERHMAY